MALVFPLTCHLSVYFRQIKQPAILSRLTWRFSSNLDPSEHLGGIFWEITHSFTLLPTSYTMFFSLWHFIRLIHVNLISYDIKSGSVLKLTVPYSVPHEKSWIHACFLKLKGLLRHHIQGLKTSSTVGKFGYLNTVWNLFCRPL